MISTTQNSARTAQFQWYDLNRNEIWLASTHWFALQKYRPTTFLFLANFCVHVCYTWKLNDFVITFFLTILWIDIWEQAEFLSIKEVDSTFVEWSELLQISAACKDTPNPFLIRKPSAIQLNFELNRIKLHCSYGKRTFQFLWFFRFTLCLSDLNFLQNKI